MEAKPSMSVGDLLCETADQVQAVSRQDGHKSLQVWPEGTHLRVFLSLFLYTQTQMTGLLSHAETEQWP